MHLMIVRKSKKEGGYILVSGNNHYEFLRKHTKKSSAPCLVDESKASSGFISLIDRFRKRKLPNEIPYMKKDRIAVNSWSIIRSFLKKEPRFKHLSRTQQIKVLRLGLQYKKTTVLSMRAKVNELLNK